MVNNLWAFTLRLLVTRLSRRMAEEKVSSQETRGERVASRCRQKTGSLEILPGDRSRFHYKDSKACRPQLQNCMDSKDS